MVWYDDMETMPTVGNDDDDDNDGGSGIGNVNDGDDDDDNNVICIINVPFKTKNNNKNMMKTKGDKIKCCRHFQPISKTTVPIFLFYF